MGIQRPASDNELTGEGALPVTVLVVDDEEAIRKTLDGILQDEGYSCVTAKHGKEALEIIRANKPDLVLLDIWMPEMDGIETLEAIRLEYIDLPVVMISGHATIQTAVQATRAGATDFIEKPLDLEGTLAVVRRALCTAQNPCEEEEVDDDASISADSRERLLSRISPLVFATQTCRGEKHVQKTISTGSILYGHGVHTGQKSGLTLEPLPPSSGIHFVGVSTATPVPAHVDYVQSTGFATTLRQGDTSVSTIEHLMSAFHAYGITNVLVKCNGEVPVLDGSSLEFCQRIESIGVHEQEGDWFEIAVRKPIRVGNGKEFIEVTPADEFSIEYTLNYPAPVGQQHMVFTLGDIEAYKRDIAPARTFGFVKDINALQQAGLAQGGRFDNFVLYGADGPVNGELRFPDEAVRHKILDAIGDLYLLGRPIRGKITACMTGHSDNIALLRAIQRELLVASE